MSTPVYSLNSSIRPENVSDSGKEHSLINSIIDNSELVMTIIGFFANIATLITLSKHGKRFGDTIASLLKHQSLIDAIVCVFAGIILISPANWVPGIYGLDTVICQLWHGQGLYWNMAFISAYNLVLIAYERFLCVCKPFKFQDFTVAKIYRLIGVVYCISLVCTCGAYLQTRMREDGCHSEYLWDGYSAKVFFSFFAISTFFTFYLIPCGFFVGFYGKVIWSFKQRQKSQNLGASGASRVIDKATSELTKTAIVVTIIFVISFGYDLWYYMLGYLGLVEYIINSPVQKIGIWFSVFNSCANPFVYAALMPTYQKAVADTFFTKCRKSNSNEED